MTDVGLLDLMNHTPKIMNHEHYESRAQKKFLTDSTMSRESFRLRHYAGYVTYNVDGFIDKNRDILYSVCNSYLRQLQDRYWYDA